MKIQSPAFKNGEKIPKKYTCQGEDLPPLLHISDVPSSCQSLCLIMDDPDVPHSIRADGLWVHWVIFNMNPNTDVIDPIHTKKATLGQNTAGQQAYMGPCPPDREHRYFFKLYALDNVLPLNAGASKVEVERAMEGHILATATLMGVYEKS